MRPGQGLEGGAPIGEVKVPGTVVAFRSMLPEDQDIYPLRDDKFSGVRRQLFANLQPIGTGLIVASVVPAVFWVVGVSVATGARVAWGLKTSGHKTP